MVGEYHAGHCRGRDCRGRGDRARVAISEATIGGSGNGKDKSDPLIAALYVDPRGIYAGLPGVEVWDEARDARLYPGPWAVVAHPPCARWCRLAGLVEARRGLRRGDDGGSFAAALASVRRWGGVLEHPAWSRAWPAFGLPHPVRGCWQRGIDGAWVTHVDQARYGHRARKSTWLYAIHAELPRLDWRPCNGGAWPSWCGNRTRGRVVERLTHRECSATPHPFRDMLLGMARSVRPQGGP